MYVCFDVLKKMNFGNSVEMEICKKPGQNDAQGA